MTGKESVAALRVRTSRSQLPRQDLRREATIASVRSSGKLLPRASSRTSIRRVASDRSPESLPLARERREIDLAEQQAKASSDSCRGARMAALSVQMGALAGSGVTLRSSVYGSKLSGRKIQGISASRIASRPRAVRMGLTESGPSVAVVGVTGAVGQEFLAVLSERNFPYSKLKLLASKRSAGKHISFEGRDYEIEELTKESFEGIDISLFSAGGSISKEYGPLAAEMGSIVVDNSSAFRMVDGVPLIVPEVNADAMAHIKLSNKKGAIIANPNCSTIICLMAATPLHRHAKVKRMVVSTYQAASGAGAAAMAELEQQTREVLDGQEPTCNIFNRQYAFNLFSHNSAVTGNGYNEEEMKLVKETRKIWNDPEVLVTATCIRVPVMRAHAESINLQFERELDENTAREILSKAEGVVVVDDRSGNNFPTPLEVSSKDDVAVGRIRKDISQKGNFGLDIFVCGDQIRKGAALNAVQIAEKLL